MRPWVVVLGASSGFGAASAVAFAAAGHPVLGLHLDTRAGQARADAVAAAITAHGVPAIMVNTNAADPEKAEHAVHTWVAAHPGARIGVLLHSLAFGALGPLVGDDGLRPRQLASTADVMAHSLPLWARLLRPHFADGARIFALTSDGARRVIPDYGAVAAAKAALEAYVRQLAVELAPVSVVAVQAGLTRTPALAKIPQGEALAAAAEARHPRGRLTTPADIAEALVALCDPRLRWMTGVTVPIDGGEHLLP